MSAQPQLLRTESEPSSLLMALSDRSSDRIRRLLTAYVFVGMAGRLVKSWAERTRTSMSYTVSVPGDDDLYDDVHRWMVDRMAPNRRKAEVARTRRSREMLDSPVGAAREQPPPLKVAYDGSGVQTVEVEGHRIRVHIDRPGADRMIVLDDRKPPDWIARQDRVIFTCPNLAARDAVERLLAALVVERHKEPPRVLISNGWGWNRQPRMARRPMGSVVLADGQMEELVADLGDFLAREPDYARLGLPYHRGYLLEGPPGCGKTSAARVLADHFDLDVYYLPLPVVEDDNRLVQLLNEVSPRSMLLLEDVDIVRASRVRDDSQHGVTLSGLLNALDGFVTPHGLVTVLTTNHASVLDSALVRPGRVDRTEHIGIAGAGQIERLLDVLLPGRHLPFVPKPTTPADIIDVFKRHLDDPHGAFVELTEVLKPGRDVDN